MKERRFCDKCITRAMDDDSRRVEGYALVFNSESRDLGGFIEVIDPHALDGVLPNSDVMCWLNHDSSRGALARRRGENVPQSVGNSLELEIDDIGLRYAFDAPSTALGDELIEGLKRGDINQSSFAFTVASDTWERVGESGMVKRTINKIEKLYDVSPVYDPAYYGTSVELDRRGYDELLEREAKEREEKEAELKAEIIDYYTELRSFL